MMIMVMIMMMIMMMMMIDDYFDGDDIEDNDND